MKTVLLCLFLLVSCIQSQEEDVTNPKPPPPRRFNYEQDRNKLFIFGVVMVPLSILIGVASATVGFTAWNIVVPLLWIGFDLELYDSLFISIFVDLLNGLTLTVIYAVQQEVNFRLGM